jgi:hypothetical protein
MPGCCCLRLLLLRVGERGGGASDGGGGTVSTALTAADCPRQLAGTGARRELGQTTATAYNCPTCVLHGIYWRLPYLPYLRAEMAGRAGPANT